VLAHQVPQPTANLVAYDRAPDDAADDESDLWQHIVVISPEQVDYHVWPAGAATAPNGQREVSTPPHPVPGRQHDERRSDRAGQTETRARPLRRRADRIARPARVRMRSRKPCFLWRRRLFG
jgi:hypothetical protein